MAAARAMPMCRIMSTSAELKTQTVLPSADTAAMLFWALLASGQINMRKIDGWRTFATKPIDQPIDLAA
jgi:putative transposase